MPLLPHELCFGCGRSNLFGLLLELEQTDPHAVSGRCFIKQDHQGADRGSAHQGVIATALAEAMALAAGIDARLAGFAVEFSGAVGVGSFLEIDARAGSDGAAVATASVDGDQVARATGRYSV